MTDSILIYIAKNEKQNWFYIGNTEALERSDYHAVEYSSSQTSKYVVLNIFD